MIGTPDKINDWTIYALPLFLGQLETLIAQVEKARAKDLKRYKKKRATKLLAAVLKVAFEDIPSDPTRDIYRQGDTLGSDYKHWFRAKFLQQFRLIFRYQRSADGGTIILAWVNDDDTLRAYESETDAYAIFRKMLQRGNPPDNWPSLLKAASHSEAQIKLKQLHSKARE